MDIISVEINNILSIEDISLKFDSNGLILLEGWNYDDNTANGAGKTAILNSITYALYDKLPRKVTATQILRNGTKAGYVSVEIQVASDVYKITRHRPKTNVVIEKNGTKVDMTQNEFESNIRLSYDQFLISMYTAQSIGNKFINLNDSGKKDFLLQLLNLNDFVHCKKEADELANATDKEIDTLNVKIENSKSKISVYKESLGDLVTLNRNIFSNQTEILAFEVEILNLQKVQKPNVQKYLDMEATISGRLDGIKEAKIKRSLLSQQYKTLSLQDEPYAHEKSDVICPHCSGNLTIKNNNVAKADDYHLQQQQHEKHLKLLKEQMLTVKNDMDSLDLIIIKEREILDLLSKIQDKKGRESEEYNKALHRMIDLKASIKTKASQNVSWQERIDTSAAVQEKIGKLESGIKLLDQEVFDKSFLLEMYRSIAAMYSPTGAPAYVLDSVIESFNDSIATYVNMVWPNASYQLKSYKENVRGDIVAKFSEELVISGKERSIGGLSGGELRCLSLCTDFAVVDILSKQFSMRLNPIMMDEPFEGLDGSNRERVVELLEKISVDRQIWVIDHASEAKAMFNKIVKVEKRSGVSSLMI